MTEYSIYISERVFDSIKADYEAHDKSCASIPHLWCGSHGGFSCFNEQAECDGCQVTFYWDGLREGLPSTGEDGYEVDTHYCDCCMRRLEKDE